MRKYFKGAYYCYEQNRKVEEVAKKQTRQSKNNN